MNRVVLIALVLLGAGCLFRGGYIQAKAWLAQQLLAHAWQKTLADGGQHKPWPWADHWPVAMLEIAGRKLVVLEGDSGAVLAFAPGRSLAGGTPENGRTVVISGHRDTHFRALADLQAGAQLALTTPFARYDYRVSAAAVADADDHQVAITNDKQLVLVTCWPFDALATQGTGRYVVTAQRTAMLTHASRSAPASMPMMPVGAVVSRSPQWGATTRRPPNGTGS